MNPINNAVAAETLATLALATASAQVGQCEKPIGSNAGGMVNEYLKAIGLNPGNPWCQAFVYWCYQQAATQKTIANPVPKLGSVLEAWRALPVAKRITADDARKNPKLVKPGAQFFLDLGRGKGHTGIVERMDENGLSFWTIEGNTNENGSREGYEVCRHQRPLANTFLKGFFNY